MIRLMKSSIHILFYFIAALSLISCAQVKNRVVVLDALAVKSQKETATSQVSSFYYLSPGDEVEVQFPYRPLLNGSYIVRPDGNLSLAIIGTIRVAGQTPDELQNEIRKRYAELSKPIENVKKEYHIDVGDELEVRFLNHKELDGVFVVRPDGKISLPLVGEIVAEGKPPIVLEGQLTTLYSTNLNTPRLVVIVRKYTSNYYYVNGERHIQPFRDLDGAVVIMRQTTPMQIFVGGEVVAPTFFDYTGPITAIQAIIKAGGVRKSGETERVAILRREPNQKPKLIIRDLTTDWVSSNETVGGGRMLKAFMGDFQLRPYDVVIVPKATVAHVKDYLDQYLYDLIPALRNSSLSFVYELKAQEQEVTSTIR